MGEIDGEEISRQLQTAVFNVVNVIVPYMHELIIKTSIVIDSDGKKLFAQNFEINHDKSSDTVSMATLPCTSWSTAEDNLETTTLLQPLTSDKANLNVTYLNCEEVIIPKLHQTSVVDDSVLASNSSNKTLVPCVACNDSSEIICENANVNLNIVNTSVINSVTPTREEILIAVGTDAIKQHSNVIVIPNNCSFTSDDFSNQTDSGLPCTKGDENQIDKYISNVDTRTPHCSMNFITRKDLDQKKDSHKVIGSIVQIKSLQEKDDIHMQETNIVNPSHINIITKSTTLGDMNSNNNVKVKRVVNKKAPDIPRKTKENDCLVKMQLKISNNEYQCLICGMKFKFQTNLTRHQKKIHGKPKSRKMYTDMYGLKEPVCEKQVDFKVEKHQDGQISSMVVLQENQNSESLLDEVLIPGPYMYKNKYTKDDQGFFTCPICERKFSFSTNLNRHLKRRHGRTALAKLKAQQKLAVVNTNKTDTLSPTKSKYDQFKDQAGNFVCPICNTHFTYSNNLRRHIKNMHKDKIQKTVHMEGSSYTSKVFSVRELQNFSYQCVACDKTFKWNAALKRHKKVIHNYKDSVSFYTRKRFRKLVLPRKHIYKNPKLTASNSFKQKNIELRDGRTQNPVFDSDVSHLLTQTNEKEDIIKDSMNMLTVKISDDSKQEISDDSKQEVYTKELKFNICEAIVNEVIISMDEGNTEPLHKESNKQTRFQDNSFSSRSKKNDKNTSGDPRRRFHCNDCGKTFTFRTNLNRHFKQVHKKDTLNNTPVKEETNSRKSLSTRTILPAPVLRQMKKNVPLKSKTELFPEKENTLLCNKNSQQLLGYIGTKYEFLHQKSGITNFLVSSSETDIDEPKNYSEIYQFEKKGLEKCESKTATEELNSVKVNLNESKQNFMRTNKSQENAISSTKDQQSNVILSKFPSAISAPLPYGRTDLTLTYGQLPESLDLVSNPKYLPNNPINKNPLALDYVNRNSSLNLKDDQTYKDVYLTDTTTEVKSSSFTFCFEGDSTSQSKMTSQNRISGGSVDLPLINSNTEGAANSSFNALLTNTSDVNISSGECIGSSNIGNKQHDSLNSINSSTTIDVVNISHETSSNFDHSNSVNVSLSKEDIVVSTEEKISGCSINADHLSNRSTSIPQSENFNFRMSQHRAYETEMQEDLSNESSSPRVTAEVNLSDMRNSVEGKTVKSNSLESNMTRENIPDTVFAQNVSTAYTPERFPVIGLYDMLSPAKSLTNGTGLENRLSLHLSYSPGRSPLGINKSPMAVSPLSSTPFLSSDDFQKNFDGRVLYSVESSPHLPSPLLNIPSFKPKLVRCSDENCDNNSCDSNLHTPGKLNEESRSLAQEEFIDIGKLMKTPEKYSIKKLTSKSSDSFATKQDFVSVSTSNCKKTSPKKISENKPEKSTSVPESFSKSSSQSQSNRVVSGRYTNNKYRFNCKLCTAKFTFRTNLTRHLRKQHGVTPGEESSS